LQLLDSGATVAAAEAVSRRVDAAALRVLVERWRTDFFVRREEDWAGSAEAEKMQARS